MINICGIKKSFDKKIVLSDATLEISNNEIVGLYGDSGSGKSTLAKILCNLIKADDGVILPKKSNVQMVYQQPFAILDPSQRIIDGVKELIKYHKICPKDQIDSFIDKMCKSVELKRDILNHYPHQISGGEAQRIAIGKALLLKPELLILDEATSMLDVSTQANIIALLKRELNRSIGAILMISHDKELIKKCCSKVFVLKKGITYEVKKDEF